MAYATLADVEARMTRELSDAEETVCQNLLEDAGAIIDSYNAEASAEAKKIVSCRMVIRALGDGDLSVPIGASQGSMSALGYTQSWTVGNGTTGELYVAKVERKLLGVGNTIGSYSPVEDMGGETCAVSL